MNDENKTQKQLIVELAGLRKHVSKLETAETGRKLTEKKEKQRLENISFLARTAMRFIEFPPDGDIYRFIGKNLMELVGESMVIINSFDSDTGLFHNRSAIGMGAMKDKILTILGRHPEGTPFKLIKKILTKLKSARLIEIHGGIYELMFGKVEKSVCNSLEELYDIRNVFMIGFTLEKKLYGMASIIMHSEIEKETCQSIETFAKQASITLQRMRVEKALRESEIRYRELANSITDVFFALDNDLKYSYWNKAFQTLTGIPAVEAIGKSIFDVFPDSNETKKASRIYKKILQTQEPQNFLNKYRFNNNECFLEIHAYPTTNGISIFAKDITEKVYSEKALRESEEKLTLQNTLLQEKNIALREILGQLEKEKEAIEKKILDNVNILLLPILERIKNSASQLDATYLKLLEDNLKRLSSDFGSAISRKAFKLTPREIEICNMVRSGSTTKEIARYLNISCRTVDTHRNSIRKKLEIANKGINLTTYLKSF